MPWRAAWRSRRRFCPGTGRPLPASAAGEQDDLPARKPPRSRPAAPEGMPRDRAAARSRCERHQEGTYNLLGATFAAPPMTMSPQPARILLVDDEQSVQKLLAYPLRKEGYEVVPALDGEEALERCRGQNFDLIVLDVMLPKLDGFDVCRQIRAQSNVPIIMLTAKAEEFDKVLGLELGADDYITKPFSMREFRSRVKAVLRRAELVRSEEGGDEPLVHGALSVDHSRRAVEVRGEPVRLTYVEFEILSALARAPGRVFSRTMLLEKLWGDSSYRDPRTIDVHIRHLREKIERDPKSPEYLFTVRGVGYHFRD